MGCGTGNAWFLFKQDFVSSRSDRESILMEEARKHRLRQSIRRREEAERKGIKSPINGDGRKFSSFLSSTNSLKKIEL